MHLKNDKIAKRKTYNLRENARLNLFDRKMHNGLMPVLNFRVVDNGNAFPVRGMFKEGK